jgi:hypothetical protein
LLKKTGSGPDRLEIGLGVQLEAEVAQYEDALVSARLNVEQTEARLKHS